MRVTVRLQDSSWDLFFVLDPRTDSERLPGRIASKLIEIVVCIVLQ